MQAITFFLTLSTAVMATALPKWNENSAPQHNALGQAGGMGSCNTMYPTAVCCDSGILDIALCTLDILANACEQDSYCCQSGATGIDLVNANCVAL